MSPGVNPAESTEVTLGEVSRGLSRVEREMQAGFSTMRAEISRLSFVPAQVYASDSAAYRDRMDRVEAALRDEGQLRHEAESLADQRAWQSRLSIMLALVGMPLSIVGSVVAGLVIAAFK